MPKLTMDKLTPSGVGIDPYKVKPAPLGHYGTNHTYNACQFIQDFYPGWSLVSFQGKANEWYWYDGTEALYPPELGRDAWHKCTDAEMKRALSIAMLLSSPNRSTINGTLELARSLVTKDFQPHAWWAITYGPAWLYVGNKKPESAATLRVSNQSTGQQIGE